MDERNVNGRKLDERKLIMHQVMLGDRVRLDAYDRALGKVVRPGDVVVDVGAGTLVLSLLALHHGAGHVYALEADPEMAALACRIAAHNHLGGRLTVVQGDARTVDLPVKADVVVSEMMGNLGPEEEMAEIVSAVARRNLKPSGVVVPARIVTRFQAVELAGEGWGVWGDDWWGFSLEPLQEYAPSKAQLHFFAREPTALTRAVVGQDDIVRAGAGRGRPELRLDVVEAGTLHAVIGWFTATLTDGVTLSNHPGYPGCNWAVWLWPVRHTQVAPGMSLRVRVRRPANVRLADEWRLDCRIDRSGRASVP